MITIDDLLLELLGGFRAFERTDLNFPFSAAINWGWCREDVHLDPRRAGLPYIHCFRSSERKVEHPFADEWPAIGDAHNGRGAGLCVRDAHDTIQRQRAMRGGHLIHVINFAIRAAPIVVWRAVPAR